MKNIYDHNLIYYLSDHDINKDIIRLKIIKINLFDTAVITVFYRKHINIFILFSIFANVYMASGKWKTVSNNATHLFLKNNHFKDFHFQWNI